MSESVYVGQYFKGSRHGRGVQTFRCATGSGKTGTLTRRGELGLVCEGSWIGGGLSKSGSCVTVVENTYPNRVQRIAERYSRAGSYLPHSLPARCMTVHEEWEQVKKGHATELASRLFTLTNGGRGMDLWVFGGGDCP